VFFASPTLIDRGFFVALLQDYRVRRQPANGREVVLQKKHIELLKEKIH
jgi:hypothetical protein